MKSQGWEMMRVREADEMSVVGDFEGKTDILLHRRLLIMTT